MSALGEKLKHELRELIPITVFFFGTVQLLALLQALMLAQFGIRVSAFLTTTSWRWSWPRWSSSASGSSACSFHDKPRSGRRTWSESTMSEANDKPLKRARGSLRSFLCSSLIAGLVTCSLPPILVGAAEQKTTESAKPPPPPAPAVPAAPATIPLADIATWATAVSNLIGNLTAGAKPSAQIENIAKTLPELSEKLDAQFAARAERGEALALPPTGGGSRGG
jgi:hypothetical protein